MTEMTQKRLRPGWRAGGGFLAACVVVVCAVLAGCQSLAPEPVRDAPDLETAPEETGVASRDDGGEVFGEADLSAPEEIPPALGSAGETLAEAGALVAGDVQGEPAESQALRGDLNADGVIDVSDRNVFVAALHTKSGAPGFNAALDFDGDGLISLVDYQAWYNSAFAGGK